MADVYLFNDTNTQQTIVDTDTFFIAEGANLALEDDAIVGTGSNYVTILGSVFSGDDNGIRHEGGILAVMVGTSGQLHSPSLYSIYTRYTQLFTLDNAGLISGYYYGVYAREDDGSASAYINNSGTISSPIGIGVRVDTGETYGFILNTGTISGYTAIQATGAGMEVTNSGTIQALAGQHSYGYAFRGTAGDDAIINSGTILGTTDTGSDADSVTNAGVMGLVDLGTDADTYNGRFGYSTDWVNGEGGDDTLLGGDYDDSFDGGEDADVLKGRRGDDTLVGGSGDDVLRGGRGDDVIEGGEGIDRLYGGKDDDSFVFSSLTDSVTGADADRIFDFSRKEDVIDLSGLGADVSISLSQKGYGTLVKVDGDGDGIVDFHIRVMGVGNLNQSDFLLDA